jgi:hypothetical protein
LEKFFAFLKIFVEGGGGGLGMEGRPNFRIYSPPSNQLLVDTALGAFGKSRAKIGRIKKAYAISLLKIQK